MINTKNGKKNNGHRVRFGKKQGRKMETEKDKFNSYQTASTSVSITDEGSKKNKFDIAKWGADNQLPLHWCALLEANNITPQLLTTKVDFAIGSGWYLYKEEIIYDETQGKAVRRKTPVRDPQIEAFLKYIDANNIFRAMATDFYFSGNVFAKVILAREPSRYGIATVEHIDSSYVRAEIMKKGKVQHYFLCNDWSKPTYNSSKLSESNVRKYKSFNKDEPFAYYRTIWHGKYYWPGHPYYGIQPWHSAFDWIDFANQILTWMKANIENSYSPKYHIQYPETYFAHLENLPEKEAEKEEEKVFNEMDDWLAGEKNAGKATYTSYSIDPLTGKDRATWKIDPLKVDQQDETYIKAWRTSNEALISAFGIDPTLANIVNDSKFSSGSQKRIAAQVHEALYVSGCRLKIVELFEYIGRANGWDEEVKIGFLGKNVVTLDQDKGGITEEQD